MSLVLVSRKAALLPPWLRNPLWAAARAVPSLDLRFAENKSLVDATTGAQLVTFTRASSGTYVDSQGVIRTATTNLLVRSEEFDAVAWTPSNAAAPTANAVVAPNGTLTADKLITTDAVTGGQVFQTFTLLASTAYTFSVFAKASEWSWCKLTTRGPENSDIGAWFNLSNGTVGTIESGVTASIQPVGDGWHRCIVTRTTGTGAAAGRQRIYSTNGDNALSTGNGTSGIYIWGAQLEQSSTVGEYIPTTSTINSAPRFDHNPTTGESLGLLVEEQRTNSIRNNTMQGAVAGTPGTLPTNWAGSSSISGLTREVVGTGTTNGINYVDIRFFGTTSATSANIVFFETNTSVVALNGQSWAASAWVTVIGGSLANITAANLVLRFNDSTGVFLSSNTTSFLSSTGSLIRYSTSGTASNAATAFVTEGITLGFPSGVAIDITLRIGLPQLEQGAFATSVIPTTTAAATRSADVASISGSNFSSWYNSTQGSLYAEPVFTNTVSFNTVYCLGDGTSSNRTRTIQLNDGTNRPLIIDSGGISQVGITGTGGVGAFKFAIGLQQDNFAVSQNGATPITDTSGILSVTDRLFLGNTDGSVFFLNGTLKRFTFWPQRLGNEVLQRITQ